MLIINELQGSCSKSENGVTPGVREDERVIAADASKRLILGKEVCFLYDPGSHPIVIPEPLCHPRPDRGSYPLRHPGLDPGSIGL